MRNALAILLICCAVPARAAEWVRVDTPNFVVYGETGEKRAREVASHFERFREALGRILSARATPSAVPTVIVVFGSQKSFEPYRPRFNGKAIELGGFFVSTEDKNLVALTLEDREEALRVIFHEYAHLVVANIAAGLPVWLNEGLAEYYSTFEVQNDGRGALIGRAIRPHIERLNTRALLPIDQLVSVGHDSAMYNEGDRRSIFYAQSWALVHMLILGEPSRSADLTTYLNATIAGTPPLDAWRSTFGSFDATASIKRYVARPVMRAYSYTFDSQMTAVTGDAQKVPPAELQAALADILIHTKRLEEAAALLQRTSAAGAPASRAKALLGLIRLEEGHDEAAGPLLLEAAADQTDWLTQYDAAAGLVRLLESSGAASPATIAPAAERAIAFVCDRRPDLANTWALRAMMRDATGTGLDEGLDAIRRARGVAPDREDYAFVQASLHARRREYAEARQVLGPLLSTRHRPEVRERARIVMGQIATSELSGTRAESEGRTERAADSTGGRFIPEFRPVGAGEQRTEGLLERVECSRNGVALHLKVDGRSMRFTAARMEDIEFITYRNDLTGSISCAARVPPDRVYLTWRLLDTAGARGGADGAVVAVEFLPIER